MCVVWNAYGMPTSSVLIMWKACIEVHYALEQACVRAICSGYYYLLLVCARGRVCVQYVVDTIIYF